MGLSARLPVFELICFHRALIVSIFVIAPVYCGRWTETAVIIRWPPKAFFLSGPNQSPRPHLVHLIQRSSPLLLLVHQRAGWNNKSLYSLGCDSFLPPVQAVVARANCSQSSARRCAPFHRVVNVEVNSLPGPVIIIIIIIVVVVVVFVACFLQEGETGPRDGATSGCTDDSRCARRVMRAVSDSSS